MKLNGRNYATDPVLKRLANSDHATLILARRLQARGPHTEGFQILDVHDDDDDDGSNQGHISDVSASQAEPDGTETVPGLHTDSAPPPPKGQQVPTATPASGVNLENVVLIEPQSQAGAEVTQTTTTEGQQQEGITEAVTEEAEEQDEETQAAIEGSLGTTLPTRNRDDDDDDSPPEHQFKCTVPGCGRTFSEHHELKGMASDLCIMCLHFDSIPQPTPTSTTINRTNARLKIVTGHILHNGSGTDMCPFIVSRDNSICRALVLLAEKRRQKRRQWIRPLSPKPRQQIRCHPCSFLPRHLPLPTHQVRQ